MPSKNGTQQDFVLDIVKGKIDGLETWKKEPGQPASMEDVASLLDNSVPRGPADVTSFHDFYKLNIAFEDVWQEVFGNELGELAQDLYTRVVQETEGGQVTTEPVEGIEDVRNLLEDAKRLLQDRAALAGVPVIVQETYSWMDAQIWSRLSFQLQSEIILSILQANVPATESQSSDLYECEEQIDFLKTRLMLPEDYEGQFPDPPGLVFPGDYRTVELALFSLIWNLHKIGYPSSSLSDESLINKISDALDPSSNATESNEETNETLIEKLSSALKECHAFNVYVPNSVNFGVLLNYRQEWDPQTYQVGELINTIPLAPKESRKYTKKQVTKESRKQKEINNALSVRKGDTAETGRTESEVVRRAKENTSFSANANMSGSVGVVSFGGSSDLNGAGEKESNRSKKNFREAVVKSSQELKNEQKMEIELTSSTEYEETVTGEISNPNEEISVTYLFYELQRRFKVCEYLNDVTPVILVANAVPTPDEITEAWLLRYEWILRRVILDDAFLKAFNLLKKSPAGQKLQIDTLRTNVQHQLRAFEDTKIELETYTTSRTATERELRGAVQKYVHAINNDPSLLDEIADSIGSRLESHGKKAAISAAGGAAGGLFGAAGGLFGTVAGLVLGDKFVDETTANNFDAPEGAQARQEAVEEALGRIDRAITDTKTRLEGVSTALDQAINKYITAVQVQLDRHLALMKLRVHVKDNILYYMQAIWDHEPPDHRFFRICDIEVPNFKDTAVVFELNTSHLYTPIEDYINLVNGIDPQLAGTIREAWEVVKSYVSLKLDALNNNGGEIDEVEVAAALNQLNLLIYKNPENPNHMIGWNWSADPRFIVARLVTISALVRLRLFFDGSSVDVLMKWQFQTNSEEIATLKEFADLDTLLGYKGNYMIFPMKADHPITTYMMHDYLDENNRVKDPDKSLMYQLQGQSGEQIWGELRKRISEEEFEKIEEAITSLLKQFEQKEIDEEALKEKLLELLAKDKLIANLLDTLLIRLTQDRISKEEFKRKLRDICSPTIKRKVQEAEDRLRKELLNNQPSDEIVVPSDLLFIAALPGTHPVLEDFKLKHRGLDVLMVAADLQEKQLELIRRQAQLLSGNYGDPDIDKHIVIDNEKFDGSIMIGTDIK